MRNVERPDSRRAWALFGALLLLIAFATATGLAGIDFGRHWDERARVVLVKAMLEKGSLLPEGFYNYPSFLILVALAASGGAVVSDLDFLLDARGLCLIVSNLAAVWVFVGLHRGGRGLAGLIAAALILLSWQFAYHARWLAPDTLVAQFVALWLLCLFACDARPSARWLWAAAAAAGLATSTKYTAGALLPATVLFHFARVRGVPLLHRFGQYAVAGLVFVAVFLIVTPGAVLDSAEFIADVRFEMEHYATTHMPFRGAFPFDVRGGWSAHLLLIVEYLAFALFSPWAPLSLAGLILAGIGAWALWREGRRALAATLVGTVAFYLAYFPLQKVFIVRNLLFLLPILATLAGVGAAAVLGALGRWPARVFAAMLAAALTTNGWFVVSAAQSIRDGTTVLPALLQRHLDTAEGGVALSRRLRRDDGLARHPRTAPLERAATAAVSMYEVRGMKVLKGWPALHHDTFTWLGPREVDFNYYPTWAGRDRIVLLPADAVRRYGIEDLFE